MVWSPQRRISEINNQDIESFLYQYVNLILRAYIYISCPSISDNFFCISTSTCKMLLFQLVSQCNFSGFMSKDIFSNVSKDIWASFFFGRQKKLFCNYFYLISLEEMLIVFSSRCGFYTWLPPEQQNKNKPKKPNQPKASQFWWYN